MIVEVTCSASPVAAYFAERIPHTYMGRRSTGLEPMIKKATTPMTTTATTTTTTTRREETENPSSNLDAHQSDQESFYSSPNGDFGSYNIEYTPPFEPTRSPTTTTTTTTTTKDFNSRLNVVTTPPSPPPPPPVAMHSASNLSFEALKSAYADKGYYAPVSAAAYESYSLGKDF